jgi:hypothetical protein
MYLDLDEACGFTIETAQYLQQAVGAANQSVQAAGAGLDESQREYVDPSLKVQVRHTGVPTKAVVMCQLTHLFHRRHRSSPSTCSRSLGAHRHLLPWSAFVAPSR